MRSYELLNFVNGDSAVLFSLWWAYWDTPPPLCAHLCLHPNGHAIWTNMRHSGISHNPSCFWMEMFSKLTRLNRETITSIMANIFVQLLLCKPWFSVLIAPLGLLCPGEHHSGLPVPSGSPSMSDWIWWYLQIRSEWEASVDKQRRRHSMNNSTMFVTSEMHE